MDVVDGASGVGVGRRRERWELTDSDLQEMRNENESEMNECLAPFKLFFMDNSSIAPPLVTNLTFILHNYLYF
jgi:hypothetical protein